MKKLVFLTVPGLILGFVIGATLFVPALSAQNFKSQMAAHHQKVEPALAQVDKALDADVFQPSSKKRTDSGATGLGENTAAETKDIEAALAAVRTSERETAVWRERVQGRSERWYFRWHPTYRKAMEAKQTEQVYVEATYQYLASCETLFDYHKQAIPLRSVQYTSETAGQDLERIRQNLVTLKTVTPPAIARGAHDASLKALGFYQGYLTSYVPAYQAKDYVTLERLSTDQAHLVSLQTAQQDWESYLSWLRNDSPLVRGASQLDGKKAEAELKLKTIK